MWILRSIVLSVVVSAAATYLLRQLLSAQSGGEAPGTSGSANVNVNTVVVPVIVGNGRGFRRGKRWKGRR